MKLSFLIAVGNCFKPQPRRNPFPFLRGGPWETFDDLKEILAANNGTLFKVKCFWHLIVHKSAKRKDFVD